MQSCWCLCGHQRTFCQAFQEFRSSRGTSLALHLVRLLAGGIRKASSPPLVLAHKGRRLYSKRADCLSFC